MSKPLAEALKGLDPSNDNHWTSDGSPRLETVKFLSGNPSITREQVTAAAPGLSRATAGAQGAQEAGGGGSPTQAAPAAPAALQGASQGAGDGAEGGTDGGAADTAAEEGDAAGEELAGAEAELQAAMAAHADATQRLSAAKTAVDRLLEAQDAQRERPHVAAARGVRAYLDAQNAHLQERGRQREALKGINLKDILPQRAALDQAFARKNSRGTQRPVGKV